MPLKTVLLDTVRIVHWFLNLSRWPPPVPIQISKFTFPPREKWESEIDIRDNKTNGKWSFIIMYDVTVWESFKPYNYIILEHCIRRPGVWITEKVRTHRNKVYFFDSRKAAQRGFACKILNNYTLSHWREATLTVPSVRRWQHSSLIHAFWCLLYVNNIPLFASDLLQSSFYFRTGLLMEYSSYRAPYPVVKYRRYNHFSDYLFYLKSIENFHCSQR